MQPKDLDTKIDLLIEAQQKIQSEIGEEFTMANAYASISSKVLKGNGFYSDKEKKEVIKLLGSHKNKELSSIPAKTLFYYLQAYQWHSYLSEDNEMSLKYSQELLRWWDQNINIKKEESYRNLIDIFNFLNLAIRLGKYHLVPKILNDLEDRTAKNEFESKLIARLLIQSKQMYFMNTGDISAATQVYQDNLKRFENLNFTDNTKLRIEINAAISFFLLEDYWKCIQIIDQYLKNKNVKIGTSIQRYGRIIKCLCFLELELVDSFESSFRSAKHFFKEIDLDNKDFDLQFIHFLYEYNYAIAQAKKNLLLKGKTIIKTESKNPKNEVLGLEEYQLWIDSKIKKQPIISLFCEKLSPANQ